MNRNRGVARIVRASLLAGSLFGSAALAQGTAVLTGTVNDAATKQPVGDVVVTATSPSLQGEQVVVTDDTGLYRIPNLPPGAYTIRLEKEAYKPFSRGDINVRIDRTIRVNVELLPEALKGEEVVVVGRAPTIDIGSTSTGVSVGSEFIRNIAVARPGGKNSASRSFESLADIAPGANADLYGVSLNGTTSPENNFVVDGLSVNDPAYGLLGTPLTVDFIQEVNVISGAFMPEYGRATGGIMNVVTKSGSNEFHGSVFGNITPGALEGETPDIKREGTVIATKTTLWNQGDFGAEMGGPVLKDKLWFYAGFAPSFTRYRLLRSLNQIRYPTRPDGTNYTPQEIRSQGIQSVKDETGFTLTDPITGTEQSYFADMRSFQYIGKLTYLLSADHNLTLSVYGTPTTSGGQNRFGIDPQDGSVEVGNIVGHIAALAHRYTANANDVSLKWSSSFMDKHALLDIALGWHHQDSGVAPMDGSRVGGTQGLAGNPGVIYRRTQAHSIAEFEDLPAGSLCEDAATAASTAVRGAKYCPVTNYRIGGPSYLDEAALDRYQGKIVGTYLFSAVGHHEVKAGLDFETMSYKHDKGYSGGYLLRESTSGTNFADIRQYGYVTEPDVTTQQLLATARSTSVTGGGFIQDSWKVLDLFALNFGVRYDQQTIYGNNGGVGMALNGQVSPRVGFVYDFTQQGRSKIFGNYARFFEGVPLDVGDRSFGDERQFMRIRFRSATASRKGCDPLKGYDRTTGEAPQTKNECLDPNNYATLGGSTDPSQLLFVTGGGDRTPVDPNLQPQSSDEIVVGGEYEVVPDGSAGITYTKRYMVNVIEDMSRDEANTYFIGNPGSGIASDFPKAVRDYDAVTLFFTKAFSDNWLAQASYTWSTLTGNYAGLFRPETGQLDPNINSDFDLISLLDNRLGPLPGDRTHQIKVYGAKEFVLSGSMAFNLGLSYRGRSGTPLNYYASHPIYGTDEVFVFPRGSGGRLPWRHDVDSHLGFTYKITKENAVTVSVDVFNLFNFAGVAGRDQRFTNSDLQPFVNKDPSKTPQEAACIAGSDAKCATPLVHTDGSPFEISEINPNFKNVSAYQAPRSVRFGAKVTF
ncbi:MAG: TonB-dependent receptor [Myxococcales bacterium]|nr:TonB-dependent receptor [Myxococcales bacterium]